MHGTVPLNSKLLAFRALQIGLKRSYGNWRMWANYMILAMDVGEFAEAARAQARVVEERAAKAGAEAVDEDVLDRLVDAVTRAPAHEIREAQAGDEIDRLLDQMEVDKGSEAESQLMSYDFDLGVAGQSGSYDFGGANR